MGGNDASGWGPDKGKEATSALHFHISLAAVNAVQDKALSSHLFASWKHANTHFLCVCVSKGEMTGVCVNSTMTCEVLAWCPIENDGYIPE